MENDITNIDCRKSNFNKLTQFVPEPLRAWLANQFNQGMEPCSITPLTKHKFLVGYKNGFTKVITVNESDYWDRLSHIEVDEVVQLPIQPK